MAEEMGKSWNTLVPYMEQIAVIMQEKLDKQPIYQQAEETVLPR